MSQGRKWTGLSLVAGVAAAAGFALSPATVQAQDDVPAVNTGAITLEAGADVVTEYVFRGTTQQNKGFIFQPYAELGVELPEIAGQESTLYVGTWNSFGDRGDKWFESDFYAGVVTDLTDTLTLDVGYVQYRDVVGDQTSAAEVAVGLSYDDTELMEQWGLFPMNPYLLVAQEFQRADGHEGTYLELGVEPEFALITEGDFPVTLSVPATVGLNLNDYYDDGSYLFGFFDVGIRAGVPLRFIPREYGDWAASAGFHMQVRGREARRDSIDDDSFNMYGTVGVSMTY